MEHQGRDDDCCEAESFHWAWLHPLSLLNGTSRAADPTWRVIGFHRLITMKMLIAKKRVLARRSYRLAGPELEVVRRGQALPRERLHCQLPFISPDLPCRDWSYLSEDSLTLSRTCSMILLASPSKALMLPKLAGTDIPRQGQKSFHNTRGVPMTKTRRSFFTLASSSVLVLALGAGPVFADSCGSNSGGGLHHGGGSSVGGAIGGVVHHLQFIFGVYHKGHSPI